MQRDARAGMYNARRQLVRLRLQLLEKAGAAATGGELVGEQRILEQVDELNRQIADIDAALSAPPLKKARNPESALDQASSAPP